MKSLQALLVGALPVLALALPGPASPSEGPQTGRLGQEGPARGGSSGGQRGDGQDGKGGQGETGRPARPDQGGGLDVFGRRRSPRSGSARDRLIGCWQMTDLVISGSSAAGRQAQGVMVVTDGFLSLELHAAFAAAPALEVEAEGAPEADIHVSFSAEYSYGEAGQLVTSTIVGSYIDEQSGLLQWERPGYRREYKVTRRANELELSWGSEGEGFNRMLFKPRLPSLRGQRDIFGAVRGSKSLDDQRDVFGRRKKLGSGERDVFGREKPAEEGEGKSGDDEKKAAPAGGGRKDDGR